VSAAKVTPILDLPSHGQTCFILGKLDTSLRQ
jgi:hypothetical protein